MEGVDLILHQGDEGRDDDGQSRQEEGWELETEGFSTPCRQERKGIPARQDFFHDLPLERAEGVEAEGLLENGSKRIGRTTGHYGILGNDRPQEAQDSTKE